MNSFLIAVQFLTILPVTFSLTLSDHQLGRSAFFYPVIGLLIGCVLALSAQLLSNSPILIQATLILILWVIITGGLHLDGLADCADAWVGGFQSKQRSLDIMKDPTSGPIAVTVLFLILLLKWTMITTVLETQSFAVLLLIPMLGRVAILFLMLSTHYIRADGLAEKIVANLPTVAIKAISIGAVLVSIYYLGVFPFISMLMMLMLIRFQAIKRLGGVTGDVYGAAVELVEASVLLSVVI